MIQLALYQYYGELFFIRKQKNIVNQALIRRYQICYTLQKTTHYVCNEEGKLEQLPFNRGLRDESGNLYDYIAGNFMIVGLGDEDFTSLPPEYIEKYSQLFAQPEILNITNGRFEVLPDASFEQQESEEPNMSM